MLRPPVRAAAYILMKFAPIRSQCPLSYLLDLGAYDALRLRGRPVNCFNLSEPERKGVSRSFAAALRILIPEITSSEADKKASSRGRKE
jgi:GTPase SAR1 family protein